MYMHIFSLPRRIQQVDFLVDTATQNPGPIDELWPLNPRLAFQRVQI